MASVRGWGSAGLGESLLNTPQNTLSGDWKLPEVSLQTDAWGMAAELGTEHTTV